MVKAVQCWDDGVVTDIRLTEILRKHNAKATFNLNPGFHGEARTAARWAEKGYSGWSHKGFLPGKLARHELRDVYGGFQVASHCMRHEVAGNVPDPVFIQSAVDARSYLEDMFQQKCAGFAWPCGQYTQSTADALLAAGFAYGRTIASTGQVGNFEHPMILHPSCHFQDKLFYDTFAKAKAENGIFYFWGHSYEMVDSPGLWRQFEDKIQFISEDPDAIWCDVVDVVASAG